MQNNSIKYNFTDFTLSAYEKLLKLVKSHYPIVDYKEAIGSDHFAVWRHDLDMSITSAYQLAQLEHKHGIKAHYFLLLHSEFYNLLEKSNTELVFKILDLGHHIQLHFDSSYYQINSVMQLEKCLQKESLFLQNIFGQEIDTFSFHNPSSFDLQCENSHFSGLINTYSEYFKTQVDYCSDSNGYWRHKRLEEVLESHKHKRIQVLTHPEWWQEKVYSPKEKVWNSIEARAEATKNYYNDLLKRNGRENIDWDN
ncbi:MAG: hypothetical protein IPM92_13580 [Saprospiraceae bacterium]|nr:hypothetical protein [Saprospiraceae bacterium]